MTPAQAGWLAFAVAFVLFVGAIIAAGRKAPPARIVGYALLSVLIGGVSIGIALGANLATG